MTYTEQDLHRWCMKVSRDSDEAFSLCAVLEAFAMRNQEAATVWYDIGDLQPGLCLDGYRFLTYAISPEGRKELAVRRWSFADGWECSGDLWRVTHWAEIRNPEER